MIFRNQGMDGWMDGLYFVFIVMRTATSDYPYQCWAFSFFFFCPLFFLPSTTQYKCSVH
jgi:hypothetical protein